jgi:hypothetical protein
MDNRENYRLQFFDRTTRGLFAAQICDIDDSEITIRFTHPDLAGLQELLLPWVNAVRLESLFEQFARRCVEGKPSSLIAAL